MKGHQTNISVPGRDWRLLLRVANRHGCSVHHLIRTAIHYAVDNDIPIGPEPCKQAKGEPHWPDFEDGPESVGPWSKQDIYELLERRYASSD